MPGCCYDTATNLEAWLPADTVWVLPGLSDFRDMLSSAERLWTEAFEAQDVEGRPQPQRLAMREASDVESACERFACVHAEPLVMGIAKGIHDLPERSLSSFEDLFLRLRSRSPLADARSSTETVAERQAADDFVLCFRKEPYEIFESGLSGWLVPFAAVFRGTAWPVRFGGAISGWR
ncbi:MAG: hypothetical protein ACLR0N_12785 [Bilophila wadsworthia]